MAERQWPADNIEKQNVSDLVPYARNARTHSSYVDVAVKRWQEFTGQDAIHETSGKTFNEIAKNKEVQHGQAA